MARTEAGAGTAVPWLALSSPDPACSGIVLCAVISCKDTTTTRLVPSPWPPAGRIAGSPLAPCCASLERPLETIPPPERRGLPWCCGSDRAEGTTHSGRSTNWLQRGYDRLRWGYESSPARLQLKCDRSRSSLAV